ncbi:TPA: cell division protein FtsQ [Proteus mirabilis]
MSQAALNNKEIKEKRHSDRPSNGSYLSGLIFFLCVIATIIWGGIQVVNWMKDANRLPISKLVLTGERHYTTNDDVRQAILSLGQPGTFMTQDVNIIQQQIERMPWIRQVTVRKQWPDKLKIHLVEYVPFTRWNDTHFLDREGRIFSLPTRLETQGNYPLLYGPQGSEKMVLAGYLAMRDQLLASNLKLKAASMSARQGWQLVLDNDVRLELGRKDTEKRIARFIELYPILQQQTDKRVDYVDLRYDSGGAVGWAPLLLDVNE